jgi:biotin transport system substrate-specific component
MTNTKLRYMIYTAIFAALTCISGFILKIPVPFLPFPITLQVFFVILAGLMLPPVYAFASQALYVLIGLAGLPVFASGGGLGYVFQPSFGILLGFMAAALVIALLKKHVKIESKLFLYTLCGTIGIIVMYIIAMPYMYGILKFYLAKDITLKYILINYCLIFIPFDLIKAVAAAFLAKQVLKRIQL